VVDFIDMSKQEHRQQLFEHMREVMDSDRARHNILPLSKFGLMQITRQRVRPDLEIETSEKCPSCGGKGEVQSSLLFTDTLREKLEFCVKELKLQNFVMYVHPFVDAYIKKGFFNSLYRSWRSELGKKFKIVPDQSLAYLQYKILNSQREEIDMREEKDVSSSATKTKRKAKARSKASSGATDAAESSSDTASAAPQAD
jgi:ribonuclease G